MGNFQPGLSGINRFTRRYNVAAVTGATAVVSPKAGFRCVITGFQFSGATTGTGLCTVTVFNTVTTTNIGLTFHFVGTATIPASVSSAESGLCLAFAADEGLSVTVAGTLTGAVNLTLEGQYISNGVALSDKYTFAVP